MTTPAEPVVDNDFFKDEEKKWFPKIEAKVKSATFVAAVTGGLVGWLGDDVFNGTDVSWLAAPVGVVVGGVFTFIAAWLTKHTPR